MVANLCHILTTNWAQIFQSFCHLLHRNLLLADPIRKKSENELISSIFIQILYLRKISQCGLNFKN